jgi:capsular polysaccharide biosynthesis protein
VSQFDNISFLKILYKWKLQLGVIVLAATLGGVLLSGEWLMKPKFKSSAILYPANLTPYGNETATEQMLQLLQSTDIRTAICDKFKLADRFSIDTNKKGAYASLYDSYNENVDIRRTEFESVKIDVYDTDPLEAAQIVDSIISMMNRKARDLQRSKTVEVIRLLKDQLDFKRMQIDSLEVTLKILREKYGLLDYYIQSKEALKRYYKLVSAGAPKERFKELDLIMKNLEEKGAESVSLKQLHQKAFETFAEIRGQYDKAVSDSRKELTYANVVAKPYPADKKSSPVRWIIILACAVSAFICGVIIIVVVENKKELLTKFK